MARYILRRCLDAAVLLVVTLGVTFVLVQLAPGDPSSRYIGGDIDPAAAARIRRNLGLDDPVPVQFVRWSASVARGDFGRSFVTGLPVRDSLATALPRTLWLTGVAFLVQILAGLLLGVPAAGRSGLAARVPTVIALVFYSLPAFCLAYLLIGVFSLHLGWLPIGGLETPGAGTSSLIDRMRHLILPAGTLALSGAAGWARYARGAVSDVLSEHHITALRARGAGPGLIRWKHGLRGALPQLITLAGVSVPYLIGGAVVVEKVFAWPGIGSLVVDAIAARDYPVVLAVNLIAAMAVVIASLAVDLSCGWLDPRTILASDPADGVAGRGSGQ